MALYKDTIDIERALKRNLSAMKAKQMDLEKSHAQKTDEIVTQFDKELEEIAKSAKSSEDVASTDK